MRTIDDFVGIPWVLGGCDYTGADCWGLLLLGLNDLYQIRIDHYKGSKAEGDKLSGIILGEAGSDRFPRSVEPKPGNVVVMQSHGERYPGHIGLYIGTGKVLHSPGSVNAGGSSRISTLRALRKQYKYVEFYEYSAS